MRLILLLFLTTCLYEPTQAQDLIYAKETVQTLASDLHKGRGYVDHGDLKSAKYISSQFDSLGLIPLGDQYFQYFDMPVNSFPKHMNLTINGSLLAPGVDYLIDPSSPSIKGTFEVITMGLDDLLDSVRLEQQLNNCHGKFIAIKSYDKSTLDKQQKKKLSKVINGLKNDSGHNIAGMIKFTLDKLTWGVSSKQQHVPVFTVHSDTIDANKVTVNVKAKKIPEYRSQNVVGYLAGERSDSTIVYTAHYDHLGMMGSKTIFPGANDNASGIAILLNLVKYYSINKPKFNTVFIAFGGEEIGLVGSQFFVKNPLIELDRIKFLLNFDISGTGDDGIQVVNGKVYRKAFDNLKEINDQQQYLKQVKIRGEACNSDHCFFHFAGVPSFFIYTLGGIQAYHDIYDRYETLPLTEFEDYFRLIVDFTDQL